MWWPIVSGTSRSVVGMKLQGGLFGGVRIRAALLALLSVTAFVLPAHAFEIHASVPEQFRDLVSENDVTEPGLADGTSFVDVFVDGQSIGDAIVRRESNTLYIDDVPGVITRIPNLSNAAQFEALLYSGIDLTGPKACAVRSSQNCEQPRIGTLGFVFDEQGSRLDIFRSYRFIQPPAPLVPSHPESIGAIAGLTLRTTGRSVGGNNDVRSSLTFDVTSGRGATSVYARGAAADDGRVFMREAGAQHFHGRHRTAAGLYLSASSDHVSQIDMIGAEWHTTDLTAPPPDTSRDTPILVFLDQEAHVDVLRGSEIIQSIKLPAGPGRLSTRQFPNGSYNVVLRIREADGTVREETRFFSRPNKYNEAARWQYGVQIGATRDASRVTRSTGSDGDPYMSVWGNRPVGDASLLSARAGYLKKTAFIEGAVDHSFEAGSLRASGLLTDKGGYSLLAQANGRFGETRLSGQVRHSDINETSNLLQRRAGLSTEANLNISREVPIIGGTASSFVRHFDRSGFQPQTSAGLSWSRSFKAYSPKNQGNFSLSFQHSPRDDRIMLRFRITRRGERSSTSAELSDIHSYGRNGFPSSNATRQTLRANWRSEAAAQNPWSLTLQLSHNGDGQGSYGIAGEYIGQSLRGDVRIDRQFGESNAMNYTGTLSTTLAGSRSGFLLTSAKNTRSGVVLARAKSSENEIETSINGRSKQVLSKANSLKPVSTFKTQKINFRISRQSTAGFDGRPIEIRAFPGNVIHVEPKRYQQVTVFARLVDEDGSPIAAAVSLDNNASALTDDAGYFVMDAPTDKAALLFQDSNKQKCVAKLPNMNASPPDQIIDLKDLVCAISLLQAQNLR